MTVQFAKGAFALARPRAVMTMPRADVSDPKAMLAQIQAAFEEFKKANDENLKGKADVVVAEKVDRINASIDAMEKNFQKAVDDLNAKVAAANGVVGDLPEDPEYLNAFKAHMRRGDVSAAMQKGTDADGGYIAPIEWDRTLTGKLKRISPIRSNARVISISTAGFKKMYTDRAFGSGWVGETASRPQTSTPAFAPLDFTPGELYAMPAATQQMLDDAAVDLEVWITDEVDTEFARQEGIAFVGGDGVNKPFGILTYVTGAANAAKHPWGAIGVKNSGAAATVTYDGLIDMVYDLPGELAGNAKFYMNRLSIASFRKLKDAGGNYLWQPSLVEGQPSTLLGTAIVEVPDMPTVAAGNIAALYGDMDATYIVVDRIGTRVLRDPYSSKPYVLFYVTKRVGGGVYNPEPMRALKISA
ncbi:phage major capsid protein [Neorhizobium alkalisoli]|uniref:HK97 family phage major capsid protein n=1 Tax=Neorhizobium alkalisoli TaxID=528178 RepID=A0A561QSH3_9HYPH|nr:phage major capsid protein [Neorhizobium alkalisoli]TWF53257.1 HK97 family phage major capsid protein [Neorhizobium alkalisoli]